MQIIQSSLARAVSAIIMGVLLIKYREQTVTWLTIVIGILFFLSGVISCAAYFVARRRESDVQLFDADGRTADLDLVVLENVGNLVCPAEFDTGSSKNAMILSVPEGDDKPLKYPLMFTVSDAVIINKIDTKSVFDFDDDAVVERIHKLNPNAEIFFISAKTGEGVDAWCQWLKKQVEEWNK